MGCHRADHGAVGNAQDEAEPQPMLHYVAKDSKKHRVRYVPRMVSHADLWALAANVAIKVASSVGRLRTSDSIANCPLHFLPITPYGNMQCYKCFSWASESSSLTDGIYF